MVNIRKTFMPAYDLVKSLAVKVKNDFVNAACKPSFAESMFDIIGMLFTYAFYVLLSLCAAFLLFIAACIAIGLVCMFPLTCGAIVLGLLLLLLVVKLVRVTHKDLVEQAKRERAREIDVIVNKWSGRHAS